MMTYGEVAHSLVSLFFAKYGPTGLLPDAYRERAEDTKVLFHVGTQHQLRQDGPPHFALLLADILCMQSRWSGNV